MTAFGRPATSWRTTREMLSIDDVLSSVRPYLRDVASLSDPLTQARWDEKRRTVLRWTLRLLATQLLTLRRERSPGFTKRLYSGSYETQTVEQFDIDLERPGRANLFKLGDERLVSLPPNGLFAAYLATPGAVIEHLKPATVAEVGFGSGKNLMYLAARFPDVTFCGWELTSSGVKLARSIQRRDTLPANLARLVGRNDRTAVEAIRRIGLHEGDARSLPAPDKSVDLTFTVLALEQMWPILPVVLPEIRRITRSHVVFLEAFREVNDWLGYLNLWARNYFRARVRTMEAAGFRPLMLLRNLPNKQTFATAVFVGEVGARPGSAP